LPIALEARSRKVKRLIVPEVNAREAAMVGDVEVYPPCGGREPRRDDGRGPSEVETSGTAGTLAFDDCLHTLIGRSLNPPDAGWLTSRC
jgi:hypothetical protein